MDNTKYYCGYILNNDKSIMLHVRKESSDKINYYNRVQIPENVDKDIMNFILTELLSIAAFDYYNNLVIKEKNTSNNDEMIPIIISFIDELGNPKIVQANKDNYEATLQEIKDTYKPINISAISLGNCYGLDIDSVADSASFNQITHDDKIATSLEQYYILNESMLCTLKNQNEE